MNLPLKYQTQGFVLLPVVLAITVVAAVAFLINRESTIQLNMAASEAEMTEAQYVAEAGMNHALWAANNSACTGYALASTSFGAHTYSASFTPTAGSPVSISATGVLASGISRSLSQDNITIYETPIVTTLQPGASDGKDAFIKADAFNKNYGVSVDIWTEKSSGGSSDDHGLLHFDVSSIPAGVKILSAELELYKNNGSGGEVNIHRVTSDWDQGTNDGGAWTGATWTQRQDSVYWVTDGGDYDAAAIASATISTTNGLYSWDITSLVSNWVNGSYANQGLILTGGTVGTLVGFSSSNNTNADQHPKLTITYACECGVTCTSGGTPLNILLVVGNDVTLPSKDSGRKALMESWGYTVTLIDDGESQATLDTAAAAADVVYVSGSIGGGTLANKLTDSTAGVVNEFYGKLDNFGFSSSTNSTVTSSSFTSTDGSHDISSPFAGSAVTHFTTSLTMPVPGGTLAADLQNVAEVSGTAALVTLDTGAQRWDANPSAGRRAHLPFWTAETSQLTDAGKTLLKRALDWAASPGGVAGVGPLAHWKLDEATGTTAMDSVGGHDGTLSTNGPVWDAGGKVDGALDFDGADDYVDLTSDAELDDIFVGGATAMAWIRPGSWGGNGYGRVFDKSSSPSSTGDGWAIRLNIDNGGLNFGQGFSSGRGWWKLPNNVINLNIWQHIAVSYDASSTANYPLIYINGSPVAVTRVDTPSGTLRSDAAINLRLGAHATGTNQNFDGKIDDARIYDRMLTATEIADIAAAASGGGGGCAVTYADDFETDDYTGNTGNSNWNGDWFEVNENNNPNTGDEQVVTQADGNSLARVRDNDGGFEGILRSADLSGYSGATLSFDYWRGGLDNSNDFVSVEVWPNATGQWEEVYRIEGPPGSDSSTGPPQSASQDISAFITNDTHIRFITSPNMGNNDSVYLDKIKICVSN